MEFDVKTLSDWLQWGFMGVISLVMWLRKPGEQHDVQIATLNTRITAIDERLKHMPDSKELANLKGTVGQIDERTKGLAEAISTIRQSQARVENYLMSNR